ncbi:MAG: hypothetical protein K2X77_18695 [Candidatus Obscuribacterales bacterium]|nr:hypothetical protein [Candidatus Obscuribacterales bacterium]
MILEAFAKYLQAADPNLPAHSILLRWLWERLTFPAQNNVDRVIRHEISLERYDTSTPESEGYLDESTGTRYTFQPLSKSGARLLNSLYEYAMSYEQQKWSRWVHCVKASDFVKKSSPQE